jgi:hypothetical protein
MVGVLEGGWTWVATAVCAAVERVRSAKALRVGRKRLNVYLRRRWITKLALEAANTLGLSNVIFS